MKIYFALHGIMTVQTFSLWIQKHLKHFLIVGSILSAILLFCYPDHVFAQAVTETSNNTDIFESIKVILGVILNIIYIIIRPILVLAGTAMDNTLIYGGFINLDRPLYTLWNISRTFANFLLVAILIVEIIRMINKEEVNKKKIVINLLAASLGINASRFLLGALIDISTVATYGIGALPMTTLNEVRQEKMPIMMVHSYLNLNSSDSNKTTTEDAWNDDIVDSLNRYNDFINNHIYYSWWSINIPTCEVYKWYIIGATQYPYILDKKDNPLDKINFGQTCTPWRPTTCTHMYCALGPTIAVDIKDFEIKKRELLYNNVKNNLESTIPNKKKENEISERMNNEVKIILDHATSNSWCTNITWSYGSISDQWVTALASVAIGSSKVDEGKKLCGQIIKNTASSSSLMIIISGDATMQNQWWLFLEELLEKSQWLVWPLVTIYISILDFSNITSVSDAMANTTTSGVIIEFIMKVAAAICMIIPLIALALVLLMRVGILWAIIAFSPFIVVITAFKESKVIASIAGSTEKYTKMGNIMGLIFAPIVPVFALGIGMIIIQTLQLRMHEWLGQSQSTWSFLGVNFQATWMRDNNPDNNETCADFRWLSQLCYDTGSDTETWSIYNDLFGWIMLNILAIGIMRAIMKASFSASTITADIANKTIDTGKSLLGSIPFLSIPGSGGKKLSMSNLLSVPGKIERNVNEKIGVIDNEGERKIEELIKGTSSWDEGEGSESWDKKSLKNLSSKTKTNIAQWLNNNGNIGNVGDIQKVIQTEAEKDAKDKTLLSQIGTMSNEQLDDFIKNLEGIEAEKKAALEKVIQEEKATSASEVAKVRELINSYKPQEWLANMEVAKEFVNKLNENIQIITAEKNSSAFKTILESKPGINSDPTKLIEYDTTTKKFVIKDK